MRHRGIRLGLLGLLGVLALGPLAQAQTLSRELRERIIKATVMITPADKNGKILGIGSGTIIDPRGYILTNYHVIGDVDNRQIAPLLPVRLIRFVDQPPEFRYFADVVKADPNLDLALIRIARDTEGRPVTNLNLPSVKLGDSDELLPGDPIFAFGFQGTGGSTITFSSGTVGGFLGEDMQSGGKQWIKHDAQTGPGNSGGGIYNEKGELIGVHTAGRGGDGNSRTAFMRPSALAWGLFAPVLLANTPQPQPNPQPGPSPAGWPVRVAVGQSFTISFPGEQFSGSFTEEDKDGPYGSATNRRGAKYDAAYLYDSKNDYMAFLLSPDGNTVLVCQVKRGGVKGGVLQGEALSIVNKQSKSLGQCTVALGGAQPVALKWPLEVKVGLSYSVTFPGDEFSGKFTEEDKDGQYGSATNRRGKSFDTGYFYDSQTDSGLFVVAVDGSTLWACEVSKSGMQGNTLQGEAVSIVNKQSKSLGKCSVTLGVAGAAPALTLSWPLPKLVGQNVSLTFPGGQFGGKFTEEDKDGQYGTATDRRGTEYDLLFVFDPKNDVALFGVGIDDSTLWVCRVARSGLQGNTLQGEALSIVNKQSKGLGKCSVTVGTTGANRSAPGVLAGFTPALNALGAS